MLYARMCGFADVRMKETGPMSHISCWRGVHLSLKVFDCGSTEHVIMTSYY